MKVIVVTNQDDTVLGIAANHKAAKRIEKRYMETALYSHQCTYHDEWEVEE